MKVQNRLRPANSLEHRNVSFEYIPDVESLRFWEILRPLRAGKEPFDLGYSGVPNGKGSIGKMGTDLFFPEAVFSV